MMLQLVTVDFWLDVVWNRSDSSRLEPSRIMVVRAHFISSRDVTINA